MHSVILYSVYSLLLMSEWIIEKTESHLDSECLGKEDLTCFPN